jgi:hypothetical protein
MAKGGSVRPFLIGFFYQFILNLCLCPGDCGPIYQERTMGSCAGDTQKTAGRATGLCRHNIATARSVTMKKTPVQRNVRTLSDQTQLLKQHRHRLDQLITFASVGKTPDLTLVQRLKKRREDVKTKILNLEGVLRTIGKPIRPSAA